MQESKFFGKSTYKDPIGDVVNYFKVWTLLVIDELLWCTKKTFKVLECTNIILKLYFKLPIEKIQKYQMFK
jgi:hypothetical protein